MFLISETFAVQISVLMETKRNILIFFPVLIYHLFGHRLVGFCAKGNVRLTKPTLHLTEQNVCQTPLTKTLEIP
jgi:hypothetical protein